jgi:hypothetical protein
MATKTWQIKNLHSETADGYVKQVSYRVNGVDGTYKFRISGEVALPKPDTLVPYADLTESTVLTWIKAKLDADKAGTVAALETEVENGVNEQKTPTINIGKPWN